MTVTDTSDKREMKESSDGKVEQRLDVFEGRGLKSDTKKRENNKNNVVEDGIRDGI